MKYSCDFNIKDENGQLAGLCIGDIVYEVQDGKMVNKVINRREIPCELALIAAGFLHTDHGNLVTEINSLGISLDEYGNIKTDATYQTSQDKIFVAGDARRGQSLVVWGISEGREAARNMDSFLMGHTILEGKTVSTFDLVK